MLTRRATLLGLGVSAAAPGSALAMAAGGERRLVVVIQRGAMDGMSAVVPYGDPGLAALRARLIPPAPGTPGGMGDLGGFFGLHPAMPNMLAMYRAGQLLPVHAVAGPWRVRSHFEAQDYMEMGNGDQRIDSGWLNRVAGNIPRPARPARRWRWGWTCRCCCAARRASAPGRRPGSDRSHPTFTPARGRWPPPIA
ncbi:MAG: DUF1501 domain-containing protein [Acetobacteraceae bacterium]